MGKSLSTFFESIFAHRFVEFRGINQGQAVLWHDHRFVTEMQDGFCWNGVLSTRYGSRRTGDFNGPVTGAASVESEMVVGIGSEVYLDRVTE